MGLFDAVNDWSDETLWLFGLFVATLVFLSLGSAGIGTGAFFQGWGAFLEVFKAVIGIQVAFGILALIVSLLPLIVIVLLGLFGLNLFNKLVGPIELTESMAQLVGGTSLQSIIVFLLIVWLLL